MLPLRVVVLCLTSLQDKNTFLKLNAGRILLVFIFILMYALNCMTPLLSDDYFISFVWPEGLRINGMLPEEAKKVSSFSDVYDSLKAYYFIWGGRIPGQTFMTLFAWWGKGWFNVVNSIMAVLLITEIYWISHEGKVSSFFAYKYIFWIFFALWAFNVAFVDTFMWLSGSCEYLWMMVLLLAFLLPYVQNYYDSREHNSNKALFAVGMFMLGLIVGCSREMLICWIILILLYWLYLCKRNGNLQSWKVSGLIGLCIGYSILIFAPGNFARLSADSHTDSVLLNSFSILFFKIIFIITIFLFHFLLWHFLATFFIRHKDVRKKIEAFNLITGKNIVLAKASALVALGTMALLLVVMYTGARPTFVTLVFLIISVALLFRASEISGIVIIHELAKMLLKTVGIVYFVTTVALSFQWNYVNNKQWEAILQEIKIDNNNPVILTVGPMPYPPKMKEFLETINAFLGNSAEIWYGAHVTRMPVFYEGCYYNIIIPQYYGIKCNKTIHDKTF